MRLVSFLERQADSLEKRLDHISDEQLYMQVCSLLGETRKALGAAKLSEARERLASKEYL